MKYYYYTLVNMVLLCLLCWFAKLASITEASVLSHFYVFMSVCFALGWIAMFVCTLVSIIQALEPSWE